VALQLAGEVRRPARPVGPLQLAQVLADAEGAAAAGQRHRADGPVVGGLAEGGDQVVLGRLVEGVERLRAVQGEPGRGPVTADLEAAHAGCPRSSTTTAVYMLTRPLAKVISCLAASAASGLANAARIDASSS
jgi:hypothetical protein